MVFVIALGFLAKLSGKFSPEAVRKIIHIGVSNWILISAHYLKTPWITILVPTIFIVANAAFVYSGAAKILGMGDRKRDNGLVYFPISIVILYLLYHASVVSLDDVVMGILIMGYGDGLAALVGRKIGKHKFSVLQAHKSVEGCLVMFVVSFVIVLLVKGQGIPTALIIALVATILEAVTPLGFDNITVPIISGLVGGFLC